MRSLVKKHADKIRFAIVGGANTTIDFSILFILKTIGFQAIASNYISTSIALIFSFIANKKFTFKDSSRNKTQFIKFLVVTLFGLWIIQPAIIWLTGKILSPINSNGYILLLIGKILATGFTLIWNYVLYRKFVYKNI